VRRQTVLVIDQQQARAAPHCATAIAGISSSSQPWITDSGTAGASNAGSGPMVSGGAIRNSARTGTSKAIRAEM